MCVLLICMYVTEQMKSAFKMFYSKKILNFYHLEECLYVTTDYSPIDKESKIQFLVLLFEYIYFFFRYTVEG